MHVRYNLEDLLKTQLQGLADDVDLEQIRVPKAAFLPLCTKKNIYFLPANKQYDILSFYDIYAAITFSIDLVLPEECIKIIIGMIHTPNYQNVSCFIKEIVPFCQNQFKNAAWKKWKHDTLGRLPAFWCTSAIYNSTNDVQIAIFANPVLKQLEKERNGENRIDWLGDSIEMEPIMNVAALNFSNLMQMFSDRFEITKGDKYETQFIPNMKRLIDRMNKETHNASIVSIFM
eukprot:12724_1